MKSFTQYLSEIFHDKPGVVSREHPDLETFPNAPDFALYHNKNAGVQTNITLLGTGSGIDADRLHAIRHRLPAHFPVSSDQAHELAHRYNNLFHPGPIAEIDFGVRQPDRPSDEFSFSTVGSKKFPSHVTKAAFDHIHHFVRSRGIKNIMYYTPDKKKHRIYQAGAKKLGITAVNMSYLGPIGVRGIDS